MGEAGVEQGGAVNEQSAQAQELFNAMRMKAEEQIGDTTESLISEAKNVTVSLQSAAEFLSLLAAQVGTIEIDKLILLGPVVSLESGVGEVESRLRAVRGRIQVMKEGNARLAAARAIIK